MGEDNIEVLSQGSLPDSSSMHDTVSQLGSSMLIFVKVLIITILFFYISKRLSASPLPLSAVNIIMSRHKGNRRRNATYSCLNNWFSTGDLAKDMITQKNTMFNSKLGSEDTQASETSKVSQTT